MLYLEDYLEMIENLPMEMRDRFTEMREMDLQVQNAMDSLEDRVKTFFKKCGSTPSLKQDWKDEQLDKLKQEYDKALEDADEKVQLANQIYEMVERHLRKLDQEVSKFKMELEADNAGITEILEKRSLEMDRTTSHANNHRAEKRKYATAFSNHVGEKRPAADTVLSSLANEAVKEAIGTNKTTSSAASSPAVAMFESTSTTSSARPNSALSYNLGHVGAGSNAAIAAAASRAIGATLEVRNSAMQQGRRTASLKASYDAVTRKADLTKEFQLGRDANTSSSATAAEAAATPPAATATTTTKSSGRNKKASARQEKQQQLQKQQAAQEQQTQAAQAQAQPASSDVAPSEEFSVDVAVEETSATAAAQWQYDPNEPRYCICNDVSYGDMVGCDNEDCPIEWFHYGCVGLAHAPKGKWYCPQCAAAMKRRGRK